MTDLAHRFAVDVLGGRPVVRDRKRFEALLASLDGRECELLIRPARKRRTLPQNAHIHALARTIAAHTGEELWRVKARAVLNVLGPEEGIESMTWMGKEMVRAKSTADLSKAECSKVVDWLLDTCTGLELAAPDPEKVGAF